MRIFSSGELTADALVLSKPGYFVQLIIQPDGTNDCTVSIYDGQDNTGTKVLPTFTFDGDGGPQVTPPILLNMSSGIYVDITLAAGTVAYSVLWAR